MYIKSFFTFVFKCDSLVVLLINQTSMIIIFDRKPKFDFVILAKILSVNQKFPKLSTLETVINQHTYKK